MHKVSTTGIYHVLCWCFWHQDAILWSHFLKWCNDHGNLRFNQLNHWTVRLSWFQDLPMNSILGFLSHRATPNVIIHFRILHEMNHPTLAWGTPMTSWTPSNSIHSDSKSPQSSGCGTPPRRALFQVSRHSTEGRLVARSSGAEEESALLKAGKKHHECYWSTHKLSQFYHEYP